MDANVSTKTKTKTVPVQILKLLIYELVNSINQLFCFFFPFYMKAFVHFQKSPFHVLDM